MFLLFVTKNCRKSVKKQLSHKTTLIRGSLGVKLEKKVIFWDVFFYEKKIAKAVYLKGIFEVTFKQYLKKKYLLKELENGGVI